MSYWSDEILRRVNAVSTAQAELRAPRERLEARLAEIARDDLLTPDLKAAHVRRAREDARRQLDAARAKVEQVQSEADAAVAKWCLSPTLDDHAVARVNRLLAQGVPLVSIIEQAKARGDGETLEVCRAEAHYTHTGDNWIPHAEVVERIEAALVDAPGGVHDRDAYAASVSLREVASTTEAEDQFTHATIEGRGARVERIAYAHAVASEDGESVE